MRPVWICASTNVADVQSFQHAITRVRGAAGIVIARGHAFAVGWMPGDGGADFAGFAREFAADDCVVNFSDLPPGELRREREVGFVVFGDDEAAAGFLVEPVDDAGPGHAADAAERAPAMMQQGVDERVFLVSGGGMHDQSGGFVEHEQRLILKKNVERDFLRLGFGGSGLRPMDLNLFAGARMVRGFDRVAVDADMALFNQPLQRAARGGGKFFTQKRVEPPGRQRFFDGEIFRCANSFQIPVAVSGDRTQRDRRLKFLHVTCHAFHWSAGFGVCSFFQVMRKISATPVQMAVSATLKAGKSMTRPPRCCR